MIKKNNIVKTTGKMFAGAIAMYTQWVNWRKWNQYHKTICYLCETLYDYIYT